MSAGLFANVSRISGMGLTLNQLAQWNDEAKTLVTKEAVLDPDASGLLGSLREPFDRLSTMVADRQDRHTSALHDTGQALDSAAHLYHEQDAENSAQLDVFDDDDDSGPPSGSDFPDPDFIVNPQAPDLNPVPRAHYQIRSSVEQAIHQVRMVDSTIRMLTGWSPTNDSLEPVKANWEELSRIAGVYDKLGVANAAISSSLEDGATKLTQESWSGSSSESFTEHANQLANPQGPGSVIGEDVARTIQSRAMGIEQSIGNQLTTLTTGLQQLVSIGGKAAPLQAWIPALPSFGDSPAGTQVRAVLQQVVDGTRSAFQNVSDQVDDLRNQIGAFLGDDPSAGGPSQVVTGWAGNARGVDPNPSFDYEMALIAQAAYDPSNPGPPGWQRVSDAQLAAKGIDVNLNDPATGFLAGVYTDGQGHYVVGYAGSTGEQQDIQTVVAEEMGMITRQYDAAAQLARQVSSAYGKDNVVYTGHSLGGGLAAVGALATGGPAVTFNAQGISDNEYRYIGLEPDAARAAASSGEIREYEMLGDYAGGIQMNIPVVSSVLPNPPGSVWLMPWPGGGLPDLSTAHNIEPMISAMEMGLRPTQEANVPDFFETGAADIAYPFVLPFVQNQLFNWYGGAP